MIRRVLVAVDDSPHAAHVVARAFEIAKNASASMRLYHAVVVPQEFPPAAATATGDPLPAHLHKIALAHMKHLVSQFDGLMCGIVIDPSHRAPRSIIEAADAYEADLIVIGSHGYDFLDRILGTTAAKVVNTSTRDVLVVHRVR